MGKLKDRGLRDQRWYEKEAYGGFWELGYRNLNVSTMGGPSTEVIELAPVLSPGARVLDLGCGEGRNSLYLAGRGFDVTAVDRSAAGIRKLEHFASLAGVKVTGIVADVATMDIEDDYELIMGHGLLHYLSVDEVRYLLTAVKDRTVDGGYNIFVYKYNSEEFPLGDEFRSARLTNSLGPSQLKEFYSDWNMVRYDVYLKWDSHPGIGMHHHPNEKMIAVKPGGLGLPFVVETLPMSNTHLDSSLFSRIEIGMAESQLESLCGKPEYVNTFVAPGLQFGPFHGVKDTGFALHQWYYGMTMVEISEHVVRAKNSFKSSPARLVAKGPTNLKENLIMQNAKNAT